MTVLACSTDVLQASHRHLKTNQFYLCVCLTKYISYNPTALPFTLSGLSPTCTTVLITTAVSKSISSGLVSNPVRVAYSRGSVTSIVPGSAEGESLYKNILKTKTRTS